MQVQKPDKKCDNLSPSAPFFSLLVPVYNTESYIARCLESCIAQSFKDIEILVIDDCGRDNAIEIAKGFAAKDSRIKIFHNPQNLGSFQARIKGIEQAKGEYILCVDSDDFIALETCQRLHERITQDYASSGVYSDICCFGMDYYPKTFKRIRPVLISQTLHKEQILQEFFIKPISPSCQLCSKVLKTSMLHKSIDFINTNLPHLPKLVMMEDLLHFFIITLFAEKSIGLKEYLYFYCDSTSSICRQKTPEITNEKILNLNILIDIFQKLRTICTSHQKAIESIDRLQKILKGAAALQYRYKKERFAYLKACITSLQYHKKWETYARIICYFFSLGKLKF